MRTRLDFPLVPIAAMVAIVAASNVLVQYPFEPYGLQEILTWGAFTYPFAFLVTDAANRAFGPKAARRVVYVGFAVGVVLSAYLATPRIAAASGIAFLAGQTLDIAVFDRLRGSAWWRAPLISSLISSAADTVLFFSLAFGETAGWASLAFGDFTVKAACALLMLAPYAALTAYGRRR